MRTWENKLRSKPQLFLMEHDQSSFSFLRSVFVERLTFTVNFEDFFSLKCFYLCFCIHFLISDVSHKSDILTTNMDDSKLEFIHSFVSVTDFIYINIDKDVYFLWQSVLKVWCFLEVSKWCSPCCYMVNCVMQW